MDLERALRELGPRLDVPEGPGFVDAVVDRIRTSERVAARPRSTRRIVALAAAAVLLLAGAAAAARFALRGVEVVPAPERPPVSPAPPGEGLGLGRQVTLEEARTTVSFPVRAPAALGRPEGVYVDTSVPEGRVSLAYRPGPGLPRDRWTRLGALVTALRAELPDDLLITKLTEEGGVVERVSVGEAPGLWLTGEPHVVLLPDPGGGVREERIRLAGDVLLWQIDEVTYRLEADVSRERAIAIARSLG